MRGGFSLIWIPALPGRARAGHLFRPPATAPLARTCSSRALTLARTAGACGLRPFPFRSCGPGASRGRTIASLRTRARQAQHPFRFLPGPVARHVSHDAPRDPADAVPVVGPSHHPTPVPRSGVEHRGLPKCGKSLPGVGQW